MASDVKAPHERIEAAVQRVRDSSKIADETTHGYMVIPSDVAELLARLLEGEAARWATRPIADWDDYRMTPTAALVAHILGEEDKA